MKGKAADPKYTSSFAVFSPDDAFLITRSSDAYLQTWETASGEPVGEPVHVGTVGIGSIGVLFSDDGQRFLTEVRLPVPRLDVWVTATGRRAGGVQGHSGYGSWLLSPGGRVIATSLGQSAFQLWEVKDWGTSTPTPQVEGERTTAYHQPTKFSRDGLLLATLTQESAAYLWNTSNGRSASPPLRHADTVSCIDFSSDGRHVVTGSSDGTARLWELTPLDLQPEIEWHPDGNGSQSDVRYSADGKRALTVGVDTVRSGSPQVAHMESRTMWHPARVSQAIFNPAGTRIATSCEDRALRLWDAATGKLLAGPLPHDDLVGDFCFSADGQTIVSVTLQGSVQGSHPNTGLAHQVYRWPTSAGQGESAVQTIAPAPKRPSELKSRMAIAIDDDANRVLLADNAGRVLAWDLLSWTDVVPVIEGERFLAFGPDGKSVCTWNPGDMQTRVRDTRTGRELTPPFPSSAEVIRVEFSRDGRRLLLISRNHTARTWDVESGLPYGSQIRLANHRDVRFSPDGTLIAVAAVREAQIRVLDAATGQLVAEPLAPFGSGNGIGKMEFSPDGGRLLVCTGYGAKIWKLPAPQPSNVDLVALAELLAGARLDQTGGLAPLSTDELRARYAKVRADLTPAEKREQREWHSRQCWAARMTPSWPAVRLHGERLAALDDPRGSEQLQDIHFRFGETEAALAACAGLIEAGGDFAALGHRYRGLALGCSRQWRAAADELALGRQTDLDQTVYWLEEATARVGAHDLVGYRKLCAEMLSQFPGKSSGQAFCGTAV
ncbi:MAG TPA: WD40 repeat domain-containing protein, partial [Pirellulales bacterium]|nr:WD40 repeat domain-containing protein [Pirellulales bacterium]